MSFTLSKRSRSNLHGVHSDLVLVVGRAIAITPVDFAVTEGVRTEERQARLVEAGASWTMDSRHLTGHAVDVVAYIDGGISWDWPLYHQISNAMFEAAEYFSIPIEWGGHWKGKKADGPHFQLPRRLYP